MICGNDIFLMFSSGCNYGKFAKRALKDESEQINFTGDLSNLHCLSNGIWEDPAHVIVTKTVHKSLPGGDGMV